MENVKKLFEELSEEEIVQILLSAMEKKQETQDLLGKSVIFVLEEHKIVEGVVTGVFKAETADGTSTAIVVHKRGLKRPREEGNEGDEAPQPPAAPTEAQTHKNGLYDD